MRGRHSPDYEEPLELDISPEEARKHARVQREMDGQAVPARRPRGPTARDLDEARRIAGYGSAPGLLGSIAYALSVGPRKRALRRALAEATRRRDAAIAAAEASYVELGRRLHERATDPGLGALRVQLAAIDHAALRNEQVKHEKRTKRELAIAHDRVGDAYRRLAEAALERGLEDVDPEGTNRVVSAVREANRLTREVELRDLGIDTYDAPGVRRGLWLIAAVAAVVGAAVALAVRG